MAAVLVPEFCDIPYYVCEIYLKNLGYIHSTIKSYDLKNEQAQREVAEILREYLESIYGNQNINISSCRLNLLEQYWKLTKSDGRIHLLDCFYTLMTKDVPVSMEGPALSTFQSSLGRGENEFCCKTVLKMETQVESSMTGELLNISNYFWDHEQKLKALNLTFDKTQDIYKKYGLSDCDSKMKTFENFQEDYFTEKQTFLDKTHEIIQQLQKSTKTVKENISKWIESKKLEYIKAGKKGDLLSLRKDCELLCKLLLQMIELLNSDHFRCLVYRSCQFQNNGKLPPQENAPSFDLCRNELIQCLQSHIKSCFVVTIQPTDVQKVTGPGGSTKNAATKTEAGQSGTGKKKLGPEFEMEVQILCGAGLEGINNVTKPIKAEFYYEGNQLARTGSSAQLHVPHSTIDKHGVAGFKRQKIKNFERPSKQNSKNEQVTSERYRIVFSTEIKLSNPDINLQLQTMSLPMAIITGSNQANSAHGALLWYCYNKNPYALENSPSSIPKQTVIEMIQACFSYLGGRQLRPDEIDYLFEIMLESNTQETVTFEDFACKAHQIINNHTFWKWLQSVLNLIQYYLLMPWNDGIIYGFVSKEKCKELLSDQPQKTFLMRFSESVIYGDGQNKNLTGAMVVALCLIKADGSSEKNHISFSRPLTVEKYFSKHSLHNIISGIRDSKTNKSLCKKVYGTTVTVRDIKEKYNEKENVTDQNYPDCFEQVMLAMISGVDQVCMSDDEPDQKKRKKPRKMSDVPIHNEPSPAMSNSGMVLSPEQTLNDPYIANQLLKKMNATGSNNNTTTFSNIPLTVQEDSYPSTNTFYPSQCSSQQPSQAFVPGYNGYERQNFSHEIQFVDENYEHSTQDEIALAEIIDLLSPNPTMSPESVSSLGQHSEMSQSYSMHMESESHNLESTSLSPEPFVTNEGGSHFSELQFHDV